MYLLKMNGLILKTAVAALAIATAFAAVLLGVYAPATEISVREYLVRIASSIPVLRDSKWFSPQNQNPTHFVCQPQTYTTSILSVDPLLIYIHDFLTDAEISALLMVGESLFQPSGVTRRDGSKVQNPHRTSFSAQLPTDLVVTQCVRARAAHFLGPLLTLDGPEPDNMLPMQLVRYGPGQRFDAHFDWFADAKRPQHNGRAWNRVATFLPVLEDACTGGETWFPNVTAPAKAAARARWKWEDDALWRVHEEGGIAVRPVKGNAVFWVNLLANGTGDVRTRHAGLPVEEGVKTAMNIWPTVFFDGV